MLAPFTYMKHVLKKSIVFYTLLYIFLYCSIETSQAMTDVKEVWIAIHKKSQTENQILCVRVWQVPMKRVTINAIAQNDPA